MAQEIAYRDPHGTTGLTLYAQRWTPTNAVWNGTGHVAFAAANWGTYAIPLVGQGGGLYTGDMPAAAAGLYYVLVYQQAGAAPAPTDATLNDRAAPIQWDGSAEIPLSGIPANVWASGSRTLTSFAFTVAATVAGGVVLAANGMDPVIIEPAVAGGVQLNARQILSVVAAALNGLITGEGTDTLTFKAAGNPTVDRISSTISSDGRQPTLLPPA